MVDEIDFRYNNPDRFPRGEVTNLLFNFFEDSNEKIMGREWKEGNLQWNVVKRCWRGEAREDVRARETLYAWSMWMMVLQRPLLCWIHVGKQVLSLKSFSNSWGNSYIQCLLLIITIHFTCGDKKILSNLKKTLKIWPGL